MKLSDVMKDYTASSVFVGTVNADDIVLAVDCGTTAASDFTGVADFAVVQGGITGVDSNLNPITQDKVYLRAGQVTVKTGNQRSFSITGDLYPDDEFQAFVLSHAIKFGKGRTVVRKYVYFNFVTGKGEKGEVSIIVNSDGSGEAGNTASIDIELKTTGEPPAEFVWGEV